MRCLTSARYNLVVDIWTNVIRQDPDSGEIRQTYEELKTGVKCQFHGVLEGGIRVAGTTERFGNIYENVDWAKMEFGPNEPINKRSQIRNVRDLRGNIIWREEEYEGSPPTVFDVQGVTPIIDGFGRHVESVALLQRHEVQ
jgi:hypothetical protein